MYKNSSLKDLGNIRTHFTRCPKLHPVIIRRPFQFPDKLRPLHFLQRQMKGRKCQSRRQKLHFPPTIGFAASTSRRKCIGTRSTFARAPRSFISGECTLTHCRIVFPAVPPLKPCRCRQGRPKTLGVGRDRRVRAFCGAFWGFQCRPLPVPAGRPSVRLEGVLGASTGGRWHLPWRLPMAGRWLDAGRKKAPVQRQGLG